MILSREMGFSARHSHKGMLYEPKHGHDYVVRVSFSGELNEEGFVVDFRAVKRLFLKLVAAELEDRDLDDLFEYPTAETISIHIWNKLAPFFPLHSVEVREKPHSRAVYFGEGK